MRVASILTILIFLACSAQAEEFKLKHDKSGQVYGPFSTANGSPVAIGSATFTVVSESGGGLSGINMPIFAPANAPLSEALKMLELYTKINDPQKKGISFTADPPAGGKPEPVVTANARNISVMDGLSFIAVATGYTYKIRASGVHLTPMEQ